MLLPLFLRLAKRDVLVVGAGAVAERKIEELVEAGAKVRVIALAATPAVEALAADRRIDLEKRAFVASDIGEAWLVIAATSDADTQREVCTLAEAARIFAIAIDDPPNGSAYSASVLRRAPLTVAISTDGEAPALARLLRELIEELLPPQDWVDHARALRAKWQAEKTPMGSRFAELVQSFKSRAQP
jgi:uroporphyrin-III C-methyltransferase/precorrin-2 dehydrogenase/sirohydrochlorin ferrochelatase